MRKLLWIMLLIVVVCAVVIPGLVPEERWQRVAEAEPGPGEWSLTPYDSEAYRTELSIWAGVMLALVLFAFGLIRGLCRGAKRLFGGKQE